MTSVNKLYPLLFCIAWSAAALYLSRTLVPLIGPTWTTIAIGAVAATSLFYGVHRTLRRPGSTIEVALWFATGVGTLVLAFAFVFQETGIFENGKTEKVDSFAECAYFSAVTWTTVGFGDYVPSKDSQPVVAMEALLGYAYMALAAGSLTSALVEAAKKRNSHYPQGDPGPNADPQ